MRICEKQPVSQESPISWVHSTDYEAKCQGVTYKEGVGGEEPAVGCEPVMPSDPGGPGPPFYST